MRITANDGNYDDVSVIRVHGNLEFVTADELDKVVVDLLKAGYYRIVMDLSNTRYISSRGWGVFLGNIKEIRQEGGDLKLAGMQPDTFEVFLLLEFGMFLHTYDSVADASLAFAPQITDKKPVQMPERSDKIKQPWSIDL